MVSPRDCPQTPDQLYKRFDKSGSPGTGDDYGPGRDPSILEAVEPTALAHYLAVRITGAQGFHFDFVETGFAFPQMVFQDVLKERSRNSEVRIQESEFRSQSGDR